MTGDPRTLAARLLAASRYAMPRADALAHIEARRRRLLAPPAPYSMPEPDFAEAETINLFDDHHAYAKEFFGRHPRTYPKSIPFAVVRKHGDNDND